MIQVEHDFTFVEQKSQRYVDLTTKRSKKNDEKY